MSAFLRYSRPHGIYHLLFRGATRNFEGLGSISVDKKLSLIRYIFFFQQKEQKLQPPNPLVVRLNKKFQTHQSNNQTIIELDYQKIIVICHLHANQLSDSAIQMSKFLTCLLLTIHDSLLNFVQQMFNISVIIINWMSFISSLSLHFSQFGHLWQRRAGNRSKIILLQIPEIERNKVEKSDLEIN